MSDRIWSGKDKPESVLRSLDFALLQLDHFSRSIILSRLGVDQSYTRNLPTRGGLKEKQGEQKKAKILGLSDKRHNLYSV